MPYVGNMRELKHASELSYCLAPTVEHNSGSVEFCVNKFCQRVEKAFF
jgi:hypothetical protein